jgi:hypothetical protein
VILHLWESIFYNLPPIAPSLLSKGDFGLGGVKGGFFISG